MRVLAVVLGLTSFTFAAPCDHGHRRGHHGHRAHHHRAHHGGHSHHYDRCGSRHSHRHGYYRTYRRGCSTRARAGYRTSRYYYPRYHGHFSYYRPYLAFAPIYSRITTVLTLDDPVFSGTDGDADKDGLPQPRTKPVGNRFLSK